MIKIELWLINNKILVDDSKDFELIQSLDQFKNIYPWIHATDENNRWNLIFSKAVNLYQLRLQCVQAAID